MQRTDDVAGLLAKRFLKHTSRPAYTINGAFPQIHDDQWRNRLAHGTYRQYKELCRGCEFEPHLEQQSFLLIENEREKPFVEKENISPRPGIEPGPST